MPRKAATYAFFLILCFNLSAKDFGPDVSVYNGEELKWEEGAHDYFVMFKSLLADEKTCLGEVLVEPYYLDASHIPSDAYVEKAFLIWTGTQQFDKIDELADNSVKLKFKSEGGLPEKAKNVFSDGHKVADPQGFEFDAFTDPEKPDISYFTYRVDITDFFKEIHESERIAGIEYDGYSLYGQYKVSGLDCATDQIYSETGTAVSGWAIILIYQSLQTRPQKIRIYDGFHSLTHKYSEMNLKGFEFIKDPKIKFTLITHEGDPSIPSTSNPDGGDAVPEGIQVRGSKVSWLLISNECNPDAEKTEVVDGVIFVDVFNSISSVYGWDWAYAEPVCIGGDPKEPLPDELEHSMDVDTFVMDSATDGGYSAHFNEGGTEINLRIGANQDRIITNMLIVATDLINPTPNFDIPMQPEMVACTPANIPVDPLRPESKWCYSDLEYTFMVRIQNWGKKDSPPVSIQTLIPAFMDYVPDSTEKQVADEWILIPDLKDNAFPLENGFKVAEKINSCYENQSDCDPVLVRFRTKLQDGLPKSLLFEAIASIKADGYPAQKTNSNIPLRLNTAATAVSKNRKRSIFQHAEDLQFPKMKMLTLKQLMKILPKQDQTVVQFLFFKVNQAPGIPALSQDHQLNGNSWLLLSSR